MSMLLMHMSKLLMYFRVRSDRDSTRWQSGHSQQFPLALFTSCSVSFRDASNSDTRDIHGSGIRQLAAITTSWRAQRAASHCSSGPSGLQQQGWVLGHGIGGVGGSSSATAESVTASSGERGRPRCVLIIQCNTTHAITLSILKRNVILRLYHTVLAERTARAM